MTRTDRRPIPDQLRQFITGSGITLYQLSQESGVHRSQLSRFVRGERDLGLEMAEKVCKVLGLNLTPGGEVSLRTNNAVPATLSTAAAEGLEGVGEGKARGKTAHGQARKRN